MQVEGSGAQVAQGRRYIVAVASSKRRKGEQEQPCSSKKENQPSDPRSSATKTTPAIWANLTCVTYVRDREIERSLVFIMLHGLWQLPGS